MGRTRDVSALIGLQIIIICAHRPYLRKKNTPKLSQMAASAARRALLSPLTPTRRGSEGYGLPVHGAKWPAAEKITLPATTASVVLHEE